MRDRGDFGGDAAHEFCARYLGHVLAERRALLGLTKEELCRRSGVNRPSVGRYERGEVLPQIPALLALCNALHIAPDALIRNLYGELCVEVARRSAAAKPSIPNPGEAAVGRAGGANDSAPQESGAAGEPGFWKRLAAYHAEVE